MRQYFMVYCYSYSIVVTMVQVLSMITWNLFTVQKHRTWHYWNCGVHLCEPIKATKKKKTEHKTSLHAVEGPASHSKATEHLCWLPCSKAPQKKTEQRRSSRRMFSKQNKTEIELAFGGLFCMFQPQPNSEGFVEKSLRVEVLQLMPDSSPLRCFIKVLKNLVIWTVVVLATAVSVSRKLWTESLECLISFTGNFYN